MGRHKADVRNLILLTALISAGAVSGRQHQHGQTIAPHEQNGDVAPTPIRWEPPALPRRSVEFESAEERKLRLTILTKDLEQPWAIAFLPDGDFLITERPGRLRLMRHGVLDPRPVPGVPRSRQAACRA